MLKHFFIFAILALYLGSNNCFESKDWDYFVFAQQWPPAACLDVPHGKCLIPEGVREWTVHGLWPTSHKGYPSFCNSSWPFRPELIKSLVQVLEIKWPNIYANTSEYSFWKHEWSKHGTCAATETMFNSEYKYFKRSLILHDDYNIFEILRKTGIYPDDSQPHMLSFIEHALTVELKKSVKLFCKNHKAYSKPILTSMYICLTKDLQIIDCDEIKEPTCQGTFVYYLPFSNSTGIR
ncbi:ribonuclease Oy-like [Uloborus diversus]|uniref:ribonuclease Oy-like n=1 Tax=Uloborus diversus TaxID=327109 RepID=UPI002409DC25|nr:ribonuclease Oy-like [Uloborus diversus]